MPKLFDDIRPYHDAEVSEALKTYGSHPMIKALLHFTFPEKNFSEIKKILNECHSIKDFQTKIIYHSVKNVIEKSSDGFTTSGFNNLEPNKPYLFISNHRDIILDTSLLNVALFENGLVMTASAIGDNLVKKPFLLALSKLNRNFLIKRGVAPREMLQNSITVSNYIKHLLKEENRSVWIAQREGRTKDGNDKTQQGVLKMIGLASGKQDVLTYLAELNIVPVAISYEFDPTDMLKMPELMAKHYDIEYKKSNNEDFNTILKGVMGQKKRMHIAVGPLLNNEILALKEQNETVNKQLQLVADVIDKHIHSLYKLWPTNYIAYDMLTKTNTFKDKYTLKQLRQFKRRIAKRVEDNNTVALENFLKMYANPVKNQHKL